MTQYNTQHKRHSITAPSIMLRVIVLRSQILFIVVLNVIMLSVVMLNVAAPLLGPLQDIKCSVSFLKTNVRGKENCQVRQKLT
jgi:hypothetical protein